MTTPKGWRPIETAPKTGMAFLAYGRHDQDAPAGASRQVRVGDHWWAIILYDIYREIGMAGAEHVFSSIVNILDPGDDPTDADIRRMDLINRELDEWRGKLSERVDPVQGRA